MAKLVDKKDKETLFRTGARYLGLGLTEMVELYEANLHLLETGMSVGKTNVPVGLQAFNAYTDFLHGGAYAAPVNQRPFFAPPGQRLKYDPGPITNVPSKGLLDFIGFLFGGGGTQPTYWIDEILWDANVPHVFPKFLSDEAYMMQRLSFSYALTTDLFKGASTGVSTLVESSSKAFERAAKGVKELRGEGEEEGYSESDLQKLMGTLALAAKAAAAIG